ncbi:MAG: hypothetical protein GXY83_25555 [Rhodopirellula sp.]|nr:hypothetical protein [Rhodopirellula sp.]
MIKILAQETLWIALLALCLPATVPAAEGEIAGAHASPHAKLRNVDLNACRWTEGFWADRFDLCRRTILPNMLRVMEKPDNSANFVNLQIAAQEREGKFFGNDWSDGDCYKWIEAAAHVYSLTREPQLDRWMDEKIATISKAQAADGYIATQIQLTDKQSWQDLRYHELYNMGHLLTAACVHQRATGKTSFLDVARKLGDYLHTVFAPRPKELAQFGFNPSNIMGAVDLYRTTGDRKLLSGIGIGGTDFFYTNVLRRSGDDVPLLNNDSAVRWPNNSHWTVPHEGSLLGGVTILETDATVLPAAAGIGLYRRVSDGSPREIKLRLIPYYAWCNRGRSDMAVWLPLSR